MFRKILLCFDGSPHSRRAAQVALMLAASQDALLQILSVVPIPQYAAKIGNRDGEYERGYAYFMAGQQELVQQATEMGIHADTRIVTGSVAYTIVECAQQGGVDLIVVGHSGHSDHSGYSGESAIWEQSLGGTADKVTDHALCSVLVVR